MSETYAYEVVDGVVVRGIVGTASWASERLGGFWVDSDTVVWVGGTWSAEEGFSPPVTDEPSEP